MDWRFYLFLGGIFLYLISYGNTKPIKSEKSKDSSKVNNQDFTSHERTKKGSIRIEGPWSSDSGLDRNVDPMEDSYVKKVIASNEGLNFNKDIAEAGEVFDVNGIEDFYDKNALITYEVNGHEIPVHMKPKVTPQTQPMFPEYGHDSPNDFSQSRAHHPHRPQSTTFYGLSMKDMPEYGVRDTPPYGNKGDPVQRHKGLHHHIMEEPPESPAAKSREDQFLRDQQIFHGDIFHKTDTGRPELPWKTQDSAAVDHQSESQDDKLSTEYSQAEEIAKVSSKLQGQLAQDEEPVEGSHAHAHAHAPEKASFFRRPDLSADGLESVRNSNHFEGYNEANDRPDRYAESKDEEREEEMSRLKRPESSRENEALTGSPPEPNPSRIVPAEADAPHFYTNPDHGDNTLPHEYDRYHSFHHFMKDPETSPSEPDSARFQAEREHDEASLPVAPEPENFHDHIQDSLSEDNLEDHYSHGENHFASHFAGLEQNATEPLSSPPSSLSEPEIHREDTSRFSSDHLDSEHQTSSHASDDTPARFFEQLEKLHESKQSGEASPSSSPSGSLKQDPEVKRNDTQIKNFMEEAEKSKAKARLLSILGELTSKLKGMEDSVKDSKKSEPDIASAAAREKEKELDKDKDVVKVKEESEQHKISDHDISEKVSKIIDSYRQSDKPFITNTELIDYKAPDIPEKSQSRKDMTTDDHKHNQGEILDSLYQADEQQQRNKAEHRVEKQQKTKETSHVEAEEHDNRPESEISAKPSAKKENKVDEDYPDYNEVKDAAIFEHNYMRKKYHSSSLQWSDNLSDKAQKIADELGQEKFLDIAKVKRIPGENVAFVKLNSLNVGKDSADNWASESNGYDFVSPILTKKNTDFVQMVWKSAKEFGLGVAKAKDGDNWIVVAMYDTPVVDDYKELKANVLPDQPLNDPYEDIIGRKK